MKIRLQKCRIVLLFVLVFGCMISVLRAADVNTIDKDDLMRILSSPDTVVIDVRTEADWNSCDVKIQGAKRGDPRFVDFWADKLAKDDRIVLYCACPGQATSTKVAQKLQKTGYSDVSVLEGGWSEWSGSQLPTERK